MYKLYIFQLIRICMNFKPVIHDFLLDDEYVFLWIHLFRLEVIIFFEVCNEATSQFFLTLLQGVPINVEVTGHCTLSQLLTYLLYFVIKFLTYVKVHQFMV